MSWCSQQSATASLHTVIQHRNCVHSVTVYSLGNSSYTPSSVSSHVALQSYISLCPCSLYPLTFTSCTGSAAHKAISSGKVDRLQHIGAESKLQEGELHFLRSNCRQLSEQPAVFMCVYEMWWFCFSALFILCCCILLTAHHRFNDSATVLYLTLCALKVMGIKYSNSRQQIT